jgi:polar amino acid transport system substrate-binding protein
MSKKVPVLFCIVLVIAFSVTPASSRDYLPGIQRIKDKGIIVVAMLNEDQPPFFMTNKKGELYGLDVRIGKDIAKELGVKIEFNRKAKTFDEVIDLVVRKEADVALSQISKTLKRSEKVLFTNPYIVLRKGLLINRLKMAQTKEDEDPIEFMIHLKGDIGVIAASSYVYFARSMFPGATIREFKTGKDIITALKKGTILAAFRDEVEIKKIIRADPGISLKVKTVVFKDTKDPIAMAVSWDNTHLLYWLNQYLGTRNFNLDADKILREYSEIFSSHDK